MLDSELPSVVPYALRKDIKATERGENTLQSSRTRRLNLHIPALEPEDTISCENPHIKKKVSINQPGDPLALK